MDNVYPSYDSVLGMPHVANLILLLDGKKEIIASELRLVLKNYAKIVQIARELESIGLIEIEVETSPRIMHVYRLTEKGRKVAEKLKEIERIIGGD